MKNPLTDDLVIAPRDADLEGLRLLADALDQADAVTVTVRSDDAEVVALPECAREGLARLVSYLAADMAVAMKPYDEILTTREAAELLGMSRPHLVQLLETEAIRIPVHKVGPGAGGHRRIALRDLVAYREARASVNDARIDRSLAELSRETGESAGGASPRASTATRRSAR